MNLFVIILFCACLLGCIVLDIPIICAMAAGGGALAAAGAPTKSVMFACFLYVLPVINVIIDIIKEFHLKNRKITRSAA